MRSRLWGRLTEVQAEQEEIRLREYMTKVILVLSLIALAGCTSLIILGWVLKIFEFEPIGIMAIMISLVSFGLWIAHRGHWRISRYILPVSFFALGLFGSYSAGIITSLALMYALAILTTALLFSSKAQIPTTLLCIVTHITVGLSFDPLPLEELLSPVIVTTGGFIGVALIQSLFAEQFKRALASSRAYAAVLKEYQDHLEDLVKQRTAALNTINEELENEIVERKQVEGALLQAHNELEVRVRERTADLSIMLEAARAVSSSLELDQVLSAIAKQMVMAIGVTGCTITRYHPHTDVLEVWAEWRRDADTNKDSAILTYSLHDFRGFEAVLKEREPISLQAENPGAYPAEVNLMQSMGAKSQLVLPIATGNQVLGLVILVESQMVREFTHSEIRLCQALTEQAAVTIENAHLHEETKRRSERLSALHDIDMAITASLDLKFTLNVMLEQVINQLNVDAASVLISDGMHNLEFAAGRGFRTGAIERTKLRLGECYAGQAALKRKLIQIPDLQVVEEKLLREYLYTEENFISYYVLPLLAKGEIMGVMEIYHRERLRPDLEWFNFLETLAGQTAIAIHNSERVANLERAKTELEVTLGATLESWISSVYQRQGKTEGQVRSVLNLTLDLAQKMDLPKLDVLQVSRGALLHDIGMIFIPEKILCKAGPLIEEEREIVQQHPQHAFDLLSRIPFLEYAIDVPYCHHERWDGTGYPRGLSGEEIPLVARVFSVVDVWVALNSDRPYRNSWSTDKVSAYILEQGGIQFDPQVVETFFKLLDSNSQTYPQKLAITGEVMYGFPPR